MNQKPLVAAIHAAFTGSAGISGAAHLTLLNDDGLGQVLIYPYYTVRMPIVHTVLTESYELKEVIEFKEYLVKYFDSLIQTTQIQTTRAH